MLFFNRTRLSPSSKQRVVGVGWGVELDRTTVWSPHDCVVSELAHPKLHLSAKQEGTRNGKGNGLAPPEHIFNFPDAIISLGRNQHSHPDLLPKRLLVREAQTHTKRNHSAGAGGWEQPEPAPAIAATEARRVPLRPSGQETRLCRAAAPRPQR